MKQRILLSIFQLLLFISLKAQTVDFAPYYPTLDGVENYAAWHIVYPESLLYAETSGEAVCTVRIDSTGYLAEKQIVASHPLFAEAAAKVIGEMTYWQPAYRDGHRVDSTIVIRIPFNPETYRDRIWRQQQILEACYGQQVDVEPGFPDEVRNLVMGNMQWPVPEVQTAVSVCRFTVGTNGLVQNVRVLQGTHPDFDKEAIRILTEFPRLRPARRAGTNIPYDYFLTINFWKMDYEYYQRYREKAQDDLGRKDVVLATPASFPGGISALEHFIDNHLVITPEMKRSGKEGRVVYRFDVDTDGAMKDFELVRGLTKPQNAEALRVLKQVYRRWDAATLFNTEKWYWEFNVEKCSLPVIFRWK